MDPPERAGGNLDVTSFTNSVSPPVKENVKGTCVALGAGDAGGVLVAVAPFGSTINTRTGIMFRSVISINVLRPRISFAAGIYGCSSTSCMPTSCLDDRDDAPTCSFLVLRDELDLFLSCSLTWRSRLGIVAQILLTLSRSA